MEKSPKANSHTWLGHVSYCHLPPLSDPRRWFALCYGSSRPTRANSERNWEGRSLGRIHLILDAGATPPRPRFLLPAIKSQAENECLLPACEGSEARRPQPACWPCSEWRTGTFLPFLIWPSKTSYCSLGPESWCSSFFDWICLSASFFSIKYH